MLRNSSLLKEATKAQSRNDQGRVFPQLDSGIKKFFFDFSPLDNTNELFFVRCKPSMGPSASVQSAKPVCRTGSSDGKYRRYK